MKYLLTTFAFLFLVGAIQYAAAQELGGGVDKEGSWYVGEGLKTGDRIFCMLRRYGSFVKAQTCILVEEYPQIRIPMY